VESVEDPLDPGVDVLRRRAERGGPAAQVTAYEVSQFGIETVIVMPGAFTQGTAHFAKASSPSDRQRAAAYAGLGGYIESYGAAIESRFAPGTNPVPVAVADEITRILALPRGGKPFRTVIDFTRSHVDAVNEAARAEAADFLTRMGYGALLTVKA
jgi:hypothetical protein